MGADLETTPRGAGSVCWAWQKQHWQLEEKEEKLTTAGPGRGEGSTGLEEGLGPWKQALEGHGPAGPLGLSQGGLGHGGWIRQGQGQHSWWPPPPFPKGRPHLCPRCSSSNSGGAGRYQTPELLPPSAELLRVLHLLWLLCPSELAGRRRSGRRATCGSQASRTA